MFLLIGIQGCGFDIELEIIKQTGKAYLIRDDLGNEMWLPKSVFSDDGELNDYGKQLYREKGGV